MNCIHNDAVIVGSHQGTHISNEEAIMSRRHAGNFRAKHPAGTVVDPAVMETVAAKMRHQQITCQRAHTIAADLSVAVSEVGIAIDLLEGRIIACQLGLFGYGQGNKLVGEPMQVDHALKSIIEASLNEGRLPCANAWKIADTEEIGRLDVARACECLGIRINQCQLGAF